MANETPASSGVTGSGTTPGVTTVADPLVGARAGTESSLSNWVGPYVTNMLAKGRAAADAPYQAYGGPLTAGASAGQQSAFSGVAGLTIPTDKMGAFTPGTFDADAAQKYMNPYLMSALQPQIDEARRQALIQQQQTRGQLTKAGAYGGGRQAIMESEGNRNLGTELSKITGAGYQNAFDKAMSQFNTEQGRMQTAQDSTNAYGLSALQKQADLGGQERGIEQEGITADMKQFEQERDYPLKQAQYLQSLLQGLPLKTETNSLVQPSDISQLLTATGGVTKLLELLFGGGSAATTAPAGTTTTAPAGTTTTAVP